MTLCEAIKALEGLRFRPWESKAKKKRDRLLRSAQTIASFPSYNARSVCSRGVVSETAAFLTTI